MKITTEHPFSEYIGYKILHKKMNRWMVCLYNPNTRERRSFLYSKYLMSIKHGRILTPEEQVDHIDGDKTNDDILNLEVVTDKENRKRQAKFNHPEMVDLICKNCGCIFTRRKSQTWLKAGIRKENIYCSQQCLYNNQRRTRIKLQFTRL